MDTTKKAELEKRIVFILLGVFGITLILGPFKPMIFANRSAMQIKHAVPIPSKAPLVIPSAAKLGMVETATLTEIDKTLAPASAKKPIPSSPDSSVYTAHELRDPLKSLLPAREEPKNVAAEPESQPETPPVPEPSVPDLHVQGLLWGSDSPKAIIDNQVYGIGATIEGATIKVISREGVIVEFNGKMVTLTIDKGSDDKNKPALSRVPRARWK